VHLPEATDIIQSARNALDSGQTLTLNEWKALQSRLYKAREVIVRIGYLPLDCDACLERVAEQIESLQAERRHRQIVTLTIVATAVVVIVAIVVGVLPYLGSKPAPNSSLVSPTIAPSTSQIPLAKPSLGTPLATTPASVSAPTPQAPETTPSATP
jgi:ActR/RegA family two-component response regulator